MTGRGVENPGTKLDCIRQINSERRMYVRACGMERCRRLKPLLRRMPRKLSPT